MKFKLPILAVFLFFYIQVKAGEYNIKKYGAVSDTSVLSTTAIQKAIDKCFTDGGGKVVIPAGSYKSGTIILKDNVELHLEMGAFLYASTNIKDFPRQTSDYQSQKNPGGWFALVFAQGAKNISISGKGNIDGQGFKHQSQPDLFGGDMDGRPRNILLISCKNVSVENITMMNSGMWNQHYLNCEDVMVTGIKVFNHSNKNNDGIDIDGCRRFVLSNSIIDSDDDGIVMKSTGPAGCEDIVITNCIISSYTNAIKCGTESTGGFKNITISNCTVKPSISKVKSFFGLGDIGITGISLEIVDGGIMDGVTVNNVVIEGTECPIYVRLGNRARKHTRSAPEPGRGQMRNISISNIIAHHTGNYSSSITGVPGSMIENISLRNIRVVNKGGLKAGEFRADISKVPEEEKSYPEPTIWKNLPSYGFFLRHIKHISLSEISLGSYAEDSRFAIVAHDITNLKIGQLSIDRDHSKPGVRIYDVQTYTGDANVQFITK